MVPETELYWLAGIFDGEGGVRLYKRANQAGHFVQCMVVSNTDAAIIERAANIVKALDLKHSFRKNGNTRSQPWYTPLMDIRIVERTSCVAFLELMLPKITGSKKHQAELCLSFLRLDRPLRGTRGHKKDPKTQAEERAIYDQQSFRPKNPNKNLGAIQ